MDKNEHNRLIAKVAKSVFKPHGIIRKGQSRTWLDDNNWFTTVIEFQPSNWSRGSYLNIGVNFHWFDKDYFSYDIGGRMKSFKEFSIPSDFEMTINEYCQEAINQVDKFRNRLKNKEEALRFITETQSSDSFSCSVKESGYRSCPLYPVCR